MRIIRPANGNTFLNGETIHLEAEAQDPAGRIIKVDFYYGTLLLNPSPERKIPFSFQWQNVAAGVHTITAVAQDNWRAVTISGPVIVTVVPNTFFGSKPAVAENKTDVYGQIRLNVATDPARGILNITVTGLTIKTQATLTILSSSGVKVTAIKFAGIDQILPVKVSSLVSGVYTLKIKDGNNVVYKKFIKL